MSTIKFDFHDEKFVVTGASSGMGRQISCELAEAGAIVLAIARREHELNELKQAYPNNIVIAAVDVCDYAAVDDAIKSFVSLNGKLDGAVHAAGISVLTPLKGYIEEEAKRVMDISFWAGVHLLSICTKVRNANVGASFVLFGSVRAVKADKGSFAYSATKASLKIAAHAFAKEVSSKDMRINTVSPGWVETDLTKEQGELHNLEEVNKNHLLGIGKPEYITGTVLFLLSDRARWITGTDVVVDGGYLA